MKYVFMLNSYGNNDTDTICKRIEAACNEFNLNYKIEVNSVSESTDDILKRYHDESCIIFAVGGDGMINKVLNGIVNTNNILGYIPYGTGNDFDKTVKETLPCGFNDIDMIRINDRYFINIACFGIDADTANDDKIIHSKIIPKSQRYNVSALYHFLKYKSRVLEISVDEETINNAYTTVVIANGRYYGGGYKVGTNSSLIDGVMDVYLIEKMKKIKMANTIMGMKSGRHETIKETRKIKTDKLIIRSDKPFKCNIDGEFLEASVFDIELIKKGIRFYNDQELINKVMCKTK